MSALIICPECGHQVSSVADICPNCGYPLQGSNNETSAIQKQNPRNNKPKKVWLFVSIVVALILLGGCLWWFLIKNNGGEKTDFVITPSFTDKFNAQEFDGFYLFNEGFAPVWKGGKYGFIDTNANLIIQLQYDLVGKFSEGLAFVQKDGKCGYIDKKGNVAIPLQYDGGGSFEDGISPVGVGGKWGAIDKKGNVIIPLEYDGIGMFYEGLARIAKGDKWGFINRKGDIVVPVQYDGVDDFKEGMAAVWDGEKFGFVDKSGALTIPIQYDYYMYFSDGLAKASLNGNSGYINKKGEMVLPMKYDDGDDFCDGLAPVHKDLKYGFINKKGDLIIPLQYDHARPFSEGVAPVSIYNEVGKQLLLINTSGEVVSTMKYSNVCYFQTLFRNGLALVEIDGIKGYMDRHGNTTVTNDYIGKKKEEQQREIQRLEEERNKPINKEIVIRTNSPRGVELELLEIIGCEGKVMYSGVHEGDIITERIYVPDGKMWVIDGFKCGNVLATIMIEGEQSWRKLPAETVTIRGGHYFRIKLSSRFSGEGWFKANFTEVKDY